MNRRKETALVISQSQPAPGIFDMWIQTEASREARPGQFIVVYPKNASTLLPRPISICETDAQKGELRIVYRVVGKGTEEFSSYEAGDTIQVLGPIGNGFPVEAGEGKKVYLMGGGIGIPPMLELAKSLQAEKTSFLGFRDSSTFLTEDLAGYSKVMIATEDGSLGTKGNVMDAIASVAAESDSSLEGTEVPDVIYACGPMPMLRAIKAYSQEKGIPAYLSLEERMACGVGACLGCVCKTTALDHHSHVFNTRICSDGPVFEAGEVEI